MQPLLLHSAGWLLLAQELAQEQANERQPLLLRLDGATRAKVLAALAALILLGFLLIALTWLGARMTRRYMGPKKKPGPTKLPQDDEWVRAAVQATDEPEEENPPEKKQG